MPLPVIPRGPELTQDRLDHFLSFSTKVPVFSLDRPLDEIVPQTDAPYTKVERINHSVLYIDMPDGRRIETWGFDDPNGAPGADRSHPSPLIRLTEGDLFHCLSRQHPTGHSEEPANDCPRDWEEGHTIHWHGIEPVASSDGVGKLSFGIRNHHPEVGDRHPEGEYTYQWRAAHAGTYFYHCHRNTLVHFEMGMFGGLIIDPKPPAGSDLTSPYVTGGPGYVRRGKGLVRYDVERLWVADDMDSRWHDTLCEDAGLLEKIPGDVNANLFYHPPEEDPDHPRLHIFEPDYFLISGVPAPRTETDERIVARVRVGETLLLRIVCGSYVPQTWRLGLAAEVIAMDARTLGNEKQNPYGFPFVVPRNRPFQLTAARRWDLLVRPTRRGTYPVNVRFFPINTVGPQQQLGRCNTFIVAE